MSGLIDPGNDAIIITPSDTEKLAKTIRGIYLGASGNLNVEMAAGTQVTFLNMAEGMVHPLMIRKVFASGTTASGIIGLL